MAKAKKPEAATHAPAQPKRGRGRPPGAKNKRTQQLEQQLERMAADISSDKLMPLDFMLEVLRNEEMPFAVRFAAAEKAAPFCHSKLSAVSVDTGAEGVHEQALKELQ